MLGLSLAQGLALLWLWRATSQGYWPGQTPVLNFPLWALAIVWPSLLLLSVDVQNLGRTIALATGFAAVVALLAAYMGWQATPYGAFWLFSLLNYTIASLLIACFKALLYLQPWAAGQRPAYEVLIALSWRNFLVVTLAVLAAAASYALLVLWGLLFSAIGIDFFQELFARDWFLFPVLTVAFGIGIHLFRRLAHLVDGLASLLEGLWRLLLPLAVGVQTVFLAALPFTGLAPLWETGNGTLLLLGLNGLVLFGANAVFGTGSHQPYPKAVHRSLFAGIALAPVVAALAAYGLYLRIDQYGWSVDRCWGVVVCAFFGLLSVAYAWHVVSRGDAWPRGLPGVNTATGWLVLAAMLLVNTPLLDFRSISLASQWQRVESGTLALRDFDFFYAKTDLARPGWQKMQELIAKYETIDPALARAIREPRALPRVAGRPLGLGPERRRPDSLEVPPGARQAADRLLEGGPFAWDIYWPRQDTDTPATWINVDLDANGEQDYVLIWAAEDSAAGIHVYFADSAWHAALLVPRTALLPGTDVLATLRDGEIRTVERTVRDLKIGDLVLSRHPEPPLHGP